MPNTVDVGIHGSNQKNDAALNDSLEQREATGLPLKPNPILAQSQYVHGNHSKDFKSFFVQGKGSPKFGEATVPSWLPAAFADEIVAASSTAVPAP